MGARDIRSLKRGARIQIYEIARVGDRAIATSGRGIKGGGPGWK